MGLGFCCVMAGSVDLELNAWRGFGFCIAMGLYTFSNILGFVGVKTKEHLRRKNLLSNL